MAYFHISFNMTNTCARLLGVCTPTRWPSVRGAAVVVVSLSALLVASIDISSVNAQQSDVRQPQIQSRQLNQRLSAVEQQLKEFQGRRGLTEQELKYLQNLQSVQHSLLKEKADIADSTLADAQNIIFLLSLMIASAGVIGYLASKVISVNVKNEARKDIDKYIKELQTEINKRIELSTIYAEAAMFRDLSYTWWKHYEVSFQGATSYEGLKQNAEFKREVEIAKTSTENGLRKIRESAEFQKAIAENLDDRYWRIYADLNNHWVYHRTVELICDDNSYSKDSDPIKELISAAETCADLSENKRAALEWYNHRETAAFAMLEIGKEIGESGFVEQATKEICRLVAGTHKPRQAFEMPTRKWRSKIRQEYTRRHQLEIPDPQ